MKFERESATSEVLLERLKPLFAHHSPQVVGAVLAELLALFIAGHAPSLRADARKELLKLVDDLVPISIERLIEEGTAPPEWRVTVQ